MYLILFPDIVYFVYRLGSGAGRFSCFRMWRFAREEGEDAVELSELTAYAGEKFQIREQRKWADFPGFSVLADPHSGKWVAFLMRQWDFDAGIEIQRCDIKCGWQSFLERPKPYLSKPFRMKGREWIGVIFDGSTEPDVVFRLFDCAVYSNEMRGYTIVLDTPVTQSAIVYPDTALPASKVQFSSAGPDVPEKIRKMQRLYDYGNGSFAQKCKNFYRQGKFMEDYEDDAPWTGDYRHYFPTYHDLNIRQLRGYFTWRTRLRKGDFAPVSTSLAYLYVYELLNGIGASSPEDALEKMREFEVGFLDSGIGDPGMRKNLRRWMLEYAVVHHVSPELARRYADPAVLKKDAALAVLRDPDGFSGEEIFSALCTFAGKKLEQSPVAIKGGGKGKSLFAAAWRNASETDAIDGRRLFPALFGERRSFPWHPLANAVYREESPHPDTDYALDGCREYHCHGGIWREERYDNLYFDRERFCAFLHETDRALRKYLKTGHYLRENPHEAWATPFVDAAIRSQRRVEAEIARPKVTIDLSHLEQIRRDAGITRDSLLIGEEWDDAEKNIRENQPPETTTAPINREDPDSADNGGAAAREVPHTEILLALLHGENVDSCLKVCRLMPSVVADAINEALFDEIGDNVLECDGDTITLVEDYRDDILQMLGG